jgi:hypothetical protein
VERARFLTAPSYRNTRHRGAVGGAAAGALIGEVASDDAGKGAALGAVGARRHAHRAEREAQAQGQQQMQQTQQVSATELANFKKALSVCLEAKNYMVKYKPAPGTGRLWCPASMRAVEGR